MLAFLVLVLQAVMKSWSINASDAVKKEDTIGGAMLKSLAESGEQGLRSEEHTSELQSPS